MKILFTDGDWRLIGSGSKYYAVISSDVQHRCRPEGMSQNWWHYCTMTICVICKEPIPDELQGLKTLYDWDR